MTPGMATNNGTGVQRAAKRLRDRRRSSRIYYAGGQPPSFLARWTSRLAIFAAIAAIVTAALHRLHLLPTPVAMTIAATVIAGALLALAMATIAGLDIWVTGRQGAARVLCGAVVALALLAVPAGTWLLSLSWPQIDDVSTDLVEPPDFTEAKEERTPDANSVEYPGERFADIQRASYPDLKSLILPRTADDAYELVLQALVKLKYKTTLELPPESDENSPGFIELSDHSLILGLVDDVVIRVLGEDQSARIDIRSASRYGQNDFGRNAERVRAILKEVAARFEASVPDVDNQQAVKQKSKLKASKVRGPGSKADRRRPDLSRSDIRRGLGRKASPQGSYAGRVPGRSQERFDE
ncbi:hypothetical protein HYPDE_29093 [Hyphomicrobium denitrificans 1NES1]|uniref:DUF1499 domain-containing protein n=1 Tax=Hyphomicrobium denitrificans 1NES1 TaxID=670307 RepID=N0B5M8_9HYPH|nr:hypothetical protein HYPDE_29093 [Hyphomicrobium denitrificans 1NES1]